MLIDEGRIKLADKLLIPNDLGQAQLGGSLQVHCSRGQARRHLPGKPATRIGSVGTRFGGGHSRGL